MLLPEYECEGIPHLAFNRLNMAVFDVLGCVNGRFEDGFVRRVRARTSRYDLTGGEPMEPYNTHGANGWMNMALNHFELHESVAE